MSQVGEAFVRVRPLATGFGTELERETAPALRKFERQVGQSGNQVRKFGRDSRDAEREIGRFGRGALVGTGVLGGLGRAAAFASTGFIGGAGLVFALKSTISAAENSQAVLAQTEQAVKRSGNSWDVYGQKIQQAALAQSTLSGFDDERLLRTFSLLVRRTDDVTEALNLNALAANVARGRNIELEAAANLVLKATLGQAGALRRLGIDAKVGASRLELIRLLTDKYTGSAAKFAATAEGAQARFNVALENTQEIIGAAVLPAITRLLNKGTDWLNNTTNQEKIQRKANQAVEVGTEFAKRLGDAYDLAAGTIGPLVKGTNELKDALNKIPKTTTGFDLFQSLGSQYNEFKDFLAKNPLHIGVEYGGVLTPGQAALALMPNLQSGFDPRLPSNPIAPGAFGSTTNDTQKLFKFGGAKPQPEVARDTKTATELARARAEGTQAQIIAASNARLSFIKDTIAFAEKLKAGSHGDTKELEDTLQKFYADEGTTQGIIDQIRQDNASAAEQRASEAQAKAEKAAADEKRRADARQRAYEATVRTRLVNLRTEVNQTKVGTAARKEADKNLTDALRAEVRDTKLSAEKRAGYASALTNELNSESAARAKIAAADKARREKDKQDALDRLEIARQTVDQNLANAVARAQLIKDPKAELAAERKADLAIINHIKERIRQTKKGTLEYAQAQGELYAAQKTFQDLGKKDKTAGGYSLEDLFQEASSEFAMYGSNVGSGPLSAQDARGAYGKLGAQAAAATLVKTHQTTVFQNFYGDRNTAQAMNDARASARNLKST